MMVTEKMKAYLRFRSGKTTAERNIYVNAGNRINKRIRVLGSFHRKYET